MIQYDTVTEVCIGQKVTFSGYHPQTELSGVLDNLPQDMPVLTLSSGSRTYFTTVSAQFPDHVW